ncbi:FAD assembly factor SdhE [Roseomonas marmotae]|uniref:FAD assembly factor SdhE n=1 Tax=Roseomonas marmotae TaxID=2768161 RepID=A0ABS3KE89_9PROT|nr:succinate dehydrogenase assembly factor 2 [Roseomonas marmotae]MBO1075302.1 succinate dehydrogenase assembly factor 2 [Roseomonas marmotae]QTI78282.1 succinate dehydrogenase assembly factor 2 [Roseomonas marmotae]
MSDQDNPHPELSPRRRRLLFRAHHRGTKEADLMIGRFVARHIASFSEAELDELEGVLELLDVDLAEWLTGRSPIPAEVMTPMLSRMAEECSRSGAGLPEGARRG